MAKKDSTEGLVEEKLTNLYQLQLTLSAIDEKRALRGELPLEVQDLEDEIAGLKTRTERIEKDIEDFQNAVTARKADIKEAEESVERYKAQLGDVRNNREYDTLQKEIEFQELEIELCNKKIKEAAVKVEEKKHELATTQHLVADKESALEEKKSELDEIMQETCEEEERLTAQAEELEAKIDPSLLYSFKKIRENERNGLGIVYVQRNACGGCFNKIPPQRKLDIKMHKKIIVCEYCGRIMIDPELANVKTETETTDASSKKTKRAERRRVSKKSEESDTKLS